MQRSPVCEASKAIGEAKVDRYGEGLRKNALARYGAGHVHDEHKNEIAADSSYVLLKQRSLCKAVIAGVVVAGLMYEVHEYTYCSVIYIDEIIQGMQGSSTSRQLGLYDPSSLRANE